MSFESGRRRGHPASLELVIRSGVMCGRRMLVGSNGDPRDSRHRCARRPGGWSDLASGAPDRHPGPRVRAAPDRRSARSGRRRFRWRRRRRGGERDRQEPPPPRRRPGCEAAGDVLRRVDGRAGRAGGRARGTAGCAVRRPRAASRRARPPVDPGRDRPALLASSRPAGPAGTGCFFATAGDRHRRRAMG